jgi:hypothetical protein
MINIDYWFEGSRFIVGALGTLTYFMCIKHNFLNLDFDKPERNSYAIPNNMVAQTFFCLIGGLIPMLMDMRQPLGWYIEGFVLRATLSSFYSAAREKTTGLEK